MKQRYFQRVGVAQDAALTLALPFQMLPVSEGESQAQDIEVADIEGLCVRFVGVGETGIGKPMPIDGAHYDAEGSAITVHIPAQHEVGEVAFIVNGKYGQVCINAKVVAVIGAGAESTITFAPCIISAIAAGGGGGDYKTDIYMDGDGRVMVERLEDGGTLILDEHENPILKRNADGSTQYFDAYQSARLMIGAHGVVEVAYTEDEVVKTLQVAEAILARTQKHLLTNAVGETTIKDEEGNVLTHAQIYAMLMTTPDFVVLVRADHAFHPNLVTETQIAFTCSYLGADGRISAERVNITSESVVSYTSGKGIMTANANGGVSIGDGNTNNANGLIVGYKCKLNNNFSIAGGANTEAIGFCSHAEGIFCKAIGNQSHAEGNSTKANAYTSHAEGISSEANGAQSHAEGTNCSTNGGTSHAEGNYCVTGTNGGSAHAEGSYTTANGAASHAEGYRTITTEGGQHAQGCWNKSEGGQYSFMHGCGTNADDLCNAFLIAGDQVYMRGIGGYDGTNYGAEGVKSVQTVIRELQLKLVNL